MQVKGEVIGDTACPVVPLLPAPLYIVSFSWFRNELNRFATVPPESKKIVRQLFPIVRRSDRII
jgi:hypothetical protein